MHNTKVGEVLGARFSTHPGNISAVIAALHARGTDVLEVITDQAHKYNAEVVASIRMNDTHGLFPDPQNPGISQFLLDHPEWVIKRLDGIPERAMDYTYPEVRDHILEILRELAVNYNIDGLELDFTRWAKLFPRQEAPFKIDIITEFIGQVREILDDAAVKRGTNHLILGAQVLESLYLCHLSGLDPRAWVQKGWMDYLIQCDYNNTNPQVPTYEFSEFCKGTNCTHHVRMGNMMGSSWSKKPYMVGRKTAAYQNNPGYGGMVLEPDEARGAAANIYGFGADGIGLWNICCNMGTMHKPDQTGASREKFQQDMFTWIAEIISSEKVWSAPRRYHFIPIYKREKLPVRNYAVNALRIGPTGSLCQIINFGHDSLGYRQVYRFLMADGSKGNLLKGKLRARFLDSTLEDDFELDINGKKIARNKIKRDFLPDDELPPVWYGVGL